MNNNLTTKLMEALQAAQQNAQSAGRAQIYPAELLLALVQQEGGVLSSILKKQELILKNSQDYWLNI